MFVHLRRVGSLVFTFVAAVSSVAYAQQNIQQTVTVVGEAEPVALGQTARSVQVVDTQPMSLSLQEIADGLRSDASVDIQQRGAMGVQSDVSIRGGTFEQTLVLLNGFRINDAQASHFNLDVPVPQQAVAGLAVLHGSGSTLYGADALAGVVHVSTWKPQESSLRLRAGGGSFGSNEQAVTGALANQMRSLVVAGERDFSTGFIPGRDYRSESASAEGRTTSSLGESDLLLAGSDRSFGANQFYGNYNSWERTKGWFLGFTQAFREKTTAAVAYRRHADNYILIRTNPAYYANNHVDASWQGALRQTVTLGHAGKLFVGAEENTDSIHSNSLGQHGRNRTSLYGDADLHRGAANFSIGLREEILSGGRVVSAPSFAASLLVRNVWKLRGSAGYGFRLPTYTNLYYNDPTTISNPSLKPETAWNFDGGVDWYPSTRVAASVTGFYARQENAIDYVRPSTTAKWQAKNLAEVRLTGVETSVQMRLQGDQQLRVNWTAIFGSQDVLQGQQSQLVFQFPTNRARAEAWLHAGPQVALRPAFSVTQRVGQTPYSTLDFAVSRDRGVLRPYVQGTNLYNTGYAEIQSIRMPGRGILAGIQIELSHR